jgi:hypothetical protein
MQRLLTIVFAFLQITFAADTNVVEFEFAEAYVRLIGNDAPPSIATMTLHEEDGQTAKLMLQRNDDGLEALLVDVLIESATAASGSDFIADPVQTISVPPGRGTSIIPFTLLDDGQLESDESFFVSLSSSARTSRAQVLVRDDERLPIYDPRFAVDVPQGIRAVAFLEQTAGGDIFAVGVGDHGTNRVWRILPDGDIDTNYLSPVIHGLVTDSALDPEKRILLAGAFTGLAHGPESIVRLTPDGSIDSGFSFRPGHDFPVPAQRITPTTSGKVVFAAMDTNGMVRIDRTKQDGEWDETFAVTLIPTTNYDGTPVNGLEAAESDKILVAGSVMNPERPAVSGLVRLNPDGGIDSEYPGIGSISAATELVRTVDSEFNVQAAIPSSTGRPIRAGATLNFDGTVKELWGAPPIARLLVPVGTNTHIGIYEFGLQQYSSGLLRYTNSRPDASFVFDLPWIGGFTLLRPQQDESLFLGLQIIWEQDDFPVFGRLLQDRVGLRAVRFSKIRYRTSEAGGPLQLEIERVGFAPDPMMVRWHAQGRTASASADFVAASGTVLFAPGERFKQISVSALEDPEIEDREHFRIYAEWDRPDGGVDRTAADVLISDNDGRPVIVGIEADMASRLVRARVTPGFAYVLQEAFAPEGPWHSGSALIATNDIVELRDGIGVTERKFFRVIRP